MDIINLTLKPELSEQTLKHETKNNKISNETRRPTAC